MPIIVPVRMPLTGDGVVDLVLAILYLGVCLYGLYTAFEVDRIYKSVYKHDGEKPKAKPIAKPTDGSFFDRCPVTCVVVGMAVFVVAVLTLTGYWWE